MSEIHSGGLVIKDPDAEEVFVVDWDREHLAAGVLISSSDWFITGKDSELTSDDESILSGSRRTALMLLGGTLRRRYTVTNRIVTNETPAQTKDASFDVLIQQE